MGKTAVLPLVLILLLASCVAPHMPVNAAPRTIAVPDDYPTISLAIQNAGSGDIILVKAGTYHEESINISKSISLIAEGISKTQLSLNPPLIQINYLHNWLWVPAPAVTINANDVRLQGFTINLPNDDYGIGSGIYAVGNRISLTDNVLGNRSVYLSGSKLNLTRNSMPAALEVLGSNLTITNNTIGKILKIHGFYNIVFHNQIGSGYYWDGIYLNGSYNCVIGNSFSSMEIEDSNYNYIVDNSFAELSLMAFGKGGCSDNIISKNEVSGTGEVNGGIGLSEGKNNAISANIISNCDLTLGTTISTAEANSIYLNNFVNNSKIVCFPGSDYTVNHFDNGSLGNYYDDYVGNDSNGDGVCDLPYTIQETHWDEELQRGVTIVFFQDNYPLMSPFDIDSVGIKLPEWASTILSPSPTPTSQESVPVPNSFPITLVFVVSVGIVIAVLGLLVYFKKRRG